MSNPDPRGACGAKIPQPDLTSDAAIGIQSSSIAGVQGVLRPDDPTAEEYVDANVDDAIEGCPAWPGTTASGSTQTVTLLHVAPEQPMPDGIDEQLGFVLKVEDSGQTAYAGVVLLRAGDVVSQVAWFGAAVVEENTVVEVMLLAASRLDGA